MIKAMTIFTAALLAAQMSHAGTWERLPGEDHTACDYRFTGQIQPGDLTRFLAELEASGLFTPRVCLDSEGGALTEVYRFLRQLNQSRKIGGVSTRIETGASCLSACAILFMFGQTFGANSPYPSREVEPGARLGFHSPFIAPGRASGVEAEEAFRAALDIAKLLIDSSYRALTSAGPALPVELVSVVLGTPGDQMHYVDTIGEQTIFGIRRINHPETNIILPNDRDQVFQTARRICATSHVMSHRTHFVEEGYRFDDLVQAVARMEAAETDLHQLTLLPAEQGRLPRIVAVLSGPYHVPGWFSAGAMLFCKVSFEVGEQGNGFRVERYSAGFGTPMFDLDDRLPDAEQVTGAQLQMGLVPIDTRY